MAYPPGKKEKPPWEKHPRPQRRQTSPGPLPGLTLHPPISFPVPSAPAGSTLTQPSSPAVDHALPWLSRTPDPAFWLPSPSVNQLAGWGGGRYVCGGGGGEGQRVESYHQTSFSPPPPTAEPELGPCKKRGKYSSLLCGAPQQWPPAHP